MDESVTSEREIREQSRSISDLKLQTCLLREREREREREE